MHRHAFFAIIGLAVSLTYIGMAAAQGVIANPVNPVNPGQGQEVCVTDPDIHLAARIRPHKKFAHLRRTGPMAARAAKLAHVRRHRPLDAGWRAASLCPPMQKAISVAYVTPLSAQQSLCQAAVGASSASVTSAQTMAMLTQAGLDEPIAAADSDDLTAAVAKAIAAHPEDAPAILAFVIENLNPADKDELAAVTKAAYNAAPDQAAGMTYAAVATNPGQTMAITQALLASASEADSSVIRQCAIDANPNLANEIATAAFVPPLASPISSIGQNDIRNNINNASGVTTLVPGLPAREPDNSPI